MVVTGVTNVALSVADYPQQPLVAGTTVTQLTTFESVIRVLEFHHWGLQLIHSEPNEFLPLAVL